MQTIKHKTQKTHLDNQKKRKVSAKVVKLTLKINWDGVIGIRQ